MYNLFRRYWPLTPTWQLLSGKIIHTRYATSPATLWLRFSLSRRLSFCDFSLSSSMASIVAFNCSLAAPIRASSGSRGKPESNHRKTSYSTWWAPLFCWSSDPDYVDTKSSDAASIDRYDTSESDSDSVRPRSKFALGCFTEDKARQLRKKTMEGSSFHDIMYHSAIASRLASDASGRSDK